jgi:hypothetical protein
MFDFVGHVAGLDKKAQQSTSAENAVEDKTKASAS